MEKKAQTVDVNVRKRRVIPFMKYKWVFASVSILFVLGSLYLVATRGINYGVDFNGGSKIVYKFSKVFGDGELRLALADLNLGEPEVIRFGSENDHSYMIKVKFDEKRKLSDEILGALKQKLNDPNIQIISEENVGPKVGAEMRERGLLALLLTWVLILVYVGFRFDFLFSPGAVVALVHDVLITLGFVIFFGKEVNLTVLAAFLTIIGFSINDTIIIYDRIRENIKKLPPKTPVSDLIDISVTDTLSRTIITSLTVFFSVVVLFFMGGSVLHDFAFCMVVGVIAGSYSTIFIASAFYLALAHYFPGKGLHKGYAKK